MNLQKLPTVVQGGLIAVLLALIGGCGDPQTERDTCEEAEAHLEACGQSSEGVFVDGCNPVLAEELLATNCSAFSDPGKADFIGDLLCRAGFYRSCTVPECEAALPADFHDWGECSELIDQEGCGACDFYRCKEETSSGMCGGEGYYLGFGYEYCLRYRLVTEPNMSPEGQQWSARTRRCLMETLDATIDDTLECDAIVSEGYDSHPSCYLGTGFCELPTVDWVRVANTIDLEDADFSLMGEIVGDCSATE